MTKIALLLIALIGSGCGASIAHVPDPTRTAAATSGTSTLPAISTATTSTTPTPTPTARVTAIPTPAATPPPIDLAPFEPLIRDLRTALETGDRVLFASLFGDRVGSYQGVSFADWTRPGDNIAYIPNTAANVEELLRPPAMRATAIVTFNNSVTGVLVEGWGSRTLSVWTGGSVQRDGQTDLAFATGTLRAGDVVFIFHTSGSAEQGRVKFFGISPATKFVKVADLP